MVLPNGISVNDFLNGPLKDWGIDVTYQAPTVTLNNQTGARTITYATGTTIRAVFKIRKLKHEQTKDGIVQLGDAYIMAKTGDSIAQWGRITHNSTYYIVGEVQRRPDADNPMFDFAECYLKDDS